MLAMVPSVGFCPYDLTELKGSLLCYLPLFFVYVTLAALCYGAVNSYEILANGTLTGAVQYNSWLATPFQSGSDPVRATCQWVYGTIAALCPMHFC